MIEVNLKVNRPYRKFPEKPKKQDLDIGLRYEMIREAVEKIQPKSDRWQ